MALESLKKIEDALEQDEVLAYKANYEVFKGGLSRNEIAKYYDKWAETGEYDTHLGPNRYTGPECAARAIAKNFAENEKSTARILDVAAGTGRLGAELYNLGFRNMDALDPSEGMLNKARERQIYTNFINDFIGLENPVPAEDNAYDGLAVSGGFGEGHIPVSALHEMIRIVRPGGIICIAMREEYLDYVSEYKGTLEPFMQNLERDGKWKLLTKDTITNYAFGKPGVVFQFVIS
ncbi:methyltransferase-like protein 27 [Mercenaria mercenaria]|uniref:methyltransferase-like protein 27 n=1 Tax=Mercenaria mercenaria TaxID=6596 RepID=UPI00234ED111|nr:methyltransferase-like protein 27 [Mercenaria mercenaria]